MGLVDVLREIGIEPDGIIGHSVGELGCAYADGCFTAKEMILSAFSRGKASIETQLVKGVMAAVGEYLKFHSRQIKGAYLELFFHPQVGRKYFTFIS